MLRIKKIMWFWLSLCCLLFSFPLSVQAENTRLPIIFEETVYRDYLSFLAGRDPLLIDDFSGPGARRSTVEIVLLQQAFALGGMPVVIEPVFGPNAARILQMARSGEYAMVANTVWYSALDGFANEFYVSPAVIRDGEFTVGLYTHESRTDLLNKPVDLSQMSAVSNSDWVSDWQTLSALPLKRLDNVAKWKNMTAMVGNGRADFLLGAPHSSEDMSFTSNGYRLVIIPNAKLGLSGTRHFVLSHKFAKAGELNAALRKGITALHAQNKIHRALVESGFIDARIGDWPLLNP